MKRVILIKQLEPIVTLGRTILTRSDLAIRLAATNEEVLRIHREEKAHLIITELEMPGLKGDALCLIIQSDTALRDVMIALICGNTPSDKERVEKCRAQAHITRPVSPQQVLSIVAKLLSMAERKSYRVLLQVTVEGASKRQPFLCNSQDVSASGILIETSHHLKRGDRITCSFFLPHAHNIVTEGEVMRTVPQPDGTFRYGVRFLTISPEHKRSIEEFVGTNLGKSGNR